MAHRSWVTGQTKGPIMIATQLLSGLGLSGGGGDDPLLRLNLEGHLAGGKRPELVREGERYRLEMVGLTATHIMAGTTFLKWGGGGCVPTLGGSLDALERPGLSDAGSPSEYCLRRIWWGGSGHLCCPPTRFQIKQKLTEL